MTGQIYSGKIIFCGRSFLPTYDTGIAPGTISREEYYRKVMQWSAAHEMGHVLGFTHNFKGKFYDDARHPGVFNSTVMDYPFPNEIANYEKVGPADVAKIAVSYLHPGAASAVDELKSFPFCGDADTGFMPDCTRFVPGRLTPVQLADRYLSLIAGGQPFPLMEHGVRSVVIKQLFSVGDIPAVKAAEKLMRIYPGNRGSLVDELANLAETSRDSFTKLAPDRQAAILKMLAESIVNPDCRLTISSQKKMVGVISSARTYPGYVVLWELLSVVEQSLRTQSGEINMSDRYKLREIVKDALEVYWKQ
jgi:hypothetical protein